MLVDNLKVFTKVINATVTVFTTENYLYKHYVLYTANV